MIKFIVAQQHINLSRLIVVAFSAIGLASCGNKLSVKAAEVRSANKTFADWCRQKADLSPETKHTVDVLLEKAGTTDCVEGDRKLSSFTTLYLTNNKISDTKPLASLTNLTELYLGNNQISDIKPLVASLTKLNRLVLYENKVSDIKPLASLTNLTVIYLDKNQISD
ncbi:leucine-rich repeat domain-containing protein, partial [Microcoleus sp. N9_A3]